MNGKMLSKHTKQKTTTLRNRWKKTRKTKLSLQLFLMANFDRVTGTIDMRAWKGRRFENILNLDRDLR